MQLYYFLQYLLNTFQMWSDLRILVVGFVDKDYSDVFSTLNALVGRQAFTRDRWKEKQEACVEVEGGRRLLVTYMPFTLFRDMGKAYSEGRTTELDNTLYHCVVIAMAFIESVLYVRHNPVVSQTLSQKFGESFLRKHCVVIVSGGDRFDKARSEGWVTKTFLEWCRSQSSDEDFNRVFHGVQERWLLFNTNGSQDELKQQRQQLVDIVDTQILVGSHYTDMKFKEVEIKAAKSEKQNSELKRELEKKTRALEERQHSDSCNMVERSQKLEQRLDEKTRSIVERQQSDSFKIMERLQEMEQLHEKSTKEFTRATERLETVEQELTSQIEEIKGELQRTRERSVWNRVVSLPQSLPVQTSPKLGLALLVLLVLLSLLIPLLRPAPTNRQREITMRNEGLDLRRYVNSKFEEATKRLREMERRIAGLKIDGQDKTGASNEKDSERADKRIQQIEEQFAELKEQVMIDSTVQVEEIQRIVEEKYSEKGSHLMEMIRSLPVSLPLLIGLTVAILSVSTVSLPVPFPALLAALFVSLLILQLLLLVLLLGA